MNSNLSSVVTTANTSPFVLASQSLNLEEFDEITDRISSIAQRERQLLNEFTNSIEAILSRESNTSISIDTYPMRSFQSIQQITCTVCLDKPRDCVLEPCMHVCSCISCIMSLTDNKCPICRTPIDFYLKLYIC